MRLFAIANYATSWWDNLQILNKKWPPCICNQFGRIPHLFKYWPIGFISYDWVGISKSRETWSGTSEPTNWSHGLNLGPKTTTGQATGRFWSGLNNDDRTTAGVKMRNHLWSVGVNVDDTFEVILLLCKFPTFEKPHLKKKLNDNFSSFSILIWPSTWRQRRGWSWRGSWRLSWRGRAGSQMVAAPAPPPLSASIRKMKGTIVFKVTMNEQCGDG